MTLLELRGVGVSFGGIRAVAGVDLVVRADALNAIIGPNGAGKTTIFNLITGIYEPTMGEVRFRGHNLSGLDSAARARRGIARTFQNIRLFKDLSVLDNVRAAYVSRVEYGLWGSVRRGAAYRAEEAALQGQAERILEETGLSAHAHAPATSLSYGNQRRLELARALATSPQLLLLDEPAAGMNPAEKHQLAELVRDLRARHHLTVLLIEHDMRFVMGISEEIVVMDHGVKIAEGPPESIRTNPQVIEAYLGPDLTTAEVIEAEQELDASLGADS